MNMSPMCEAGEPNLGIACDLRAEWDVFNKTTGQRYLVCKRHLTTFIVEGHTFTISPARSKAQRDGKGLTVGEAQRLGVCRICGEKNNGKGGMVFGFGYEHAHKECMDEEAVAHLNRVLSKRGPFRGD